MRDVHAQVHDPKWWEENKHRKGDDYDAEYFKQFGYEELGFGRTYETMVFRAIPSKDGCCPYEQASGSEFETRGYKDPDDAYRGHLEMCKTWSRKHR